MVAKSVCKSTRNSLLVLQIFTGHWDLSPLTPLWPCPWRLTLMDGTKSSLPSSFRGEQ